jgi:hypothetical protein
MPPVANPNPDRARRASAELVAAAPAVADQGIVTTTAPAPAPALPVIPAVASSPALRTPGAATGVFGIMPVRETGLARQQQTERKRTLTPQRDDPAWKCVTIIEEADQPRWQCGGCGAHRSGGATKIADHVLGIRGSAKCTGTDAAFLQIVDQVRASEGKKSEKKSQKSAVAAANSAAITGAMVVGTKPKMQQSALSFTSSQAEACDAAIAELFYACNISASVVDHPKFKTMVTTIKAAPPSYKPPTRQKLYGALLDDTVSRLRREIEPFRASLVRDGATLISDGWDNVNKDHLINCLFGNASCLLFDGTVQLSSDDGESADFVAELLRQCMERNGPFAFVQIVTDTCSVMKAAWKLLQREYPWLVTTCCATHVLSLELKDLGKLPEVASIISKVHRQSNFNTDM